MRTPHQRFSLAVVADEHQDEKARITAPKPLATSMTKLRKASRSLSRKKHTSKNWFKAKAKLNKLHAQIKNKRTDFLHKISTQLTKAGRFFPSSQLCSSCNTLREERLELHQRTFCCLNCNLHLDQDLNAAANLAQYETYLTLLKAAAKRSEAQNACGEESSGQLRWSQLTKLSPVKQELLCKQETSEKDGVYVT